MDNFKEKILGLLGSIDEQNWALGLQLESSMGIDLDNFWHNLHLLASQAYNNGIIPEPEKENILRYIHKSFCQKKYCTLSVHILSQMHSQEPMPNFLSIQAIRLNADARDTHSSRKDQNPNSYKAFCLFPNVNYLRIQSVSVFPMGLEHLPKLEEIALFYTASIKQLPDSIALLPRLKIFRLLQVKIDSLPDNIGEASALRQLLLMGCGLLSLPDSMGKLSQLEMLDLEANNIVHLPESLPRLKKLNWLRLNNNPHLDWVQVSHILLQMPQLKTIYIFKRLQLKIEEKEGERFFSMLINGDNGYANGEKYTKELYSLIFDIIVKIPNLRKLAIHSVYYLKSIPDNIALCRDLEDLSFRSCNLESLPDALFTMPKLRKLNLGSNRLRELPEGILQLQQLQNLTISKNRIDKLPEAIGDMPNLQFIDIVNCSLRQLPVSLRKIPNRRGTIKIKT